MLTPCGPVLAVSPAPQRLTLGTLRRRNSNLQKRIDKKADTRKAKREKKLARPGFEGRASGFIS